MLNSRWETVLEQASPFGTCASTHKLRVYFPHSNAVVYMTQKRIQPAKLLTEARKQFFIVQINHPVSKENPSANIRLRYSITVLPGQMSRYLDIAYVLRTLLIIFIGFGYIAQAGPVLQRSDSVIVLNTQPDRKAVTSPQNLSRRSILDPFFKTLVLVAYTTINLDVDVQLGPFTLRQYITALANLADGISTLTSGPPPLGLVLRKVIEFQYGLLKVQIRSATDLTWSIVRRVVGALKGFFVDGVIEFFVLALEVATGVWVWVFFGISPFEWFGRNELDVP